MASEHTGGESLAQLARRYIDTRKSIDAKVDELTAGGLTPAWAAQVRAQITKETAEHKAILAEILDRCASEEG